MALKIVELLAEHGGVVGLILGLPFISLCLAIIVLWKQNTKNQERMIKLIEQSVRVDTSLSMALNGLKEVVQAQRSRP